MKALRTCLAWLALGLGCTGESGSDASLPPPGVDGGQAMDEGVDLGSATRDAQALSDLGALPDFGPLPDLGEVIPLDLFPLSVGSSWTFEVTDPTNPGEVSSKTQTVVSTTTLPGIAFEVFVLETQKSNGRLTRSLQADTGEALVRYEEESFEQDGTLRSREEYEPSKLRVPRSLIAPGLMISQTYTERSFDQDRALVSMLTKTEDWTVEAIEEITVPAGTFMAVRIRRQSRTTTSDKRYWFAEGVGKVKEESARQVEALASWN